MWCIKRTGFAQSLFMPSSIQRRDAAKAAHGGVASRGKAVPCPIMPDKEIVGFAAVAKDVTCLV